MHALKLSPNLRKHSLESRKAILNGNKKKFHSLEVKKLDIILAMVNDPEEVIVVHSEEELS